MFAVKAFLGKIGGISGYVHGLSSSWPQGYPQVAHPAGNRCGGYQILVSYLIACHEPKHANPPSVC